MFDRGDFPDFDDFFPDFDEEFRRITDEVDRVFRRAMEGGLPTPEEGGPFVYGFSMRVGPDGKPKIEQFGNTGRFIPLRGREEWPTSEFGAAWEPITDTIVGDKEIFVTLEMPGVEKKDIDLEVKKDAVSVNAKAEDRNYHKEVELPHEVDPEKAKATYHNGVLEVVIPLLGRLKDKGKKVKIE